MIELNNSLYAIKGAVDKSRNYSDNKTRSGLICPEETLEHTRRGQLFRTVLFLANDLGAT